MGILPGEGQDIPMVGDDLYFCAFHVQRGRCPGKWAKIGSALAFERPFANRYGSGQCSQDNSMGINFPGVPMKLSDNSEP